MGSTANQMVQVHANRLTISQKISTVFESPFVTARSRCVVAEACSRDPVGGLSTHVENLRNLKGTVPCAQKNVDRVVAPIADRDIHETILVEIAFNHGRWDKPGGQLSAKIEAHRAEANTRARAGLGSRARATHCGNVLLVMTLALPATRVLSGSRSEVPPQDAPVLSSHRWLKVHRVVVPSNGSHARARRYLRPDAAGEQEREG
jgi:hypothetical protein